MGSTVRVPIEPSTGTGRVARIEAARGETESFQIAVRATGGALSHATVTTTALTDRAGHRIAAPALAREQYVRIRRHSPAWSGRPLSWTWIPDALVPFVDPVTGRTPRSNARYAAGVFGVPRGHAQPVWADVTVPRDASPGLYTGRWTARSDQGGATGEVVLRVRDVTLPVVPAAGSRFGIWQQANRVPAVEDLLLRYRVQPAPVPSTRAKGLLANGLSSVDLAFWSGADVEHCAMPGAPTADAIRAAKASYDVGVRTYDYSADEIGECPGIVTRLREWARVLHGAAVEHLVTVVPRADLMDDGTGRPVVDIWVLMPWQLRSLDPALRAQVEATGGELWSYQALVQGARTPSWQLDLPVTNYRVLGGFLNASQGVQGLLYWAVDRWQRDPWVDPTYTHTTSCCYPGDGTLVYPGHPAGVVGVVPSIRLAMVRDGMDDYDLVAQLRARGQGAPAAAVIARAASSWSSWTTDGRVLADVRRQLLDLLEATG